MIGIVASLDEEAFEDVVAYIGTLEEVSASEDDIERAKDSSQKLNMLDTPEDSPV